MRRRFIVMVAAMGLVAASCGGSDDSLSSYFDTVVEVNVDYVAAIADLPVASTDSPLEDISGFFNGVVAAIAPAIDELGKAAPPDEASTAHQDYLHLWTEFSELTVQIAARADAATNQDDVLAMANDPVMGVTNFSNLISELILACNGLQSIADSNSLEASLNCAALDG